MLDFDLMGLVGESYAVYQERRERLILEIKKEYPGVKNGRVVLFSSFEKPDVVFRQESTFYYFSGLEESGLAMIIDMDGKSSLFVPNCVQERKKWNGSAIEPNDKDAQCFNFDTISVLGDKIKGSVLYPYFDESAYKNVLGEISAVLDSGGKFFVLSPNNAFQYVEQRFVLDRIKSFLPKFLSKTGDTNFVDMSPLVTIMRRKKDISEIGKISEAIAITGLAHESAAIILENGETESHVQATLEYAFNSVGAKTAYPTIVASGHNATILHYQDNYDDLEDGELVIVDAGAKFGNYCSDITRTYPISGKFTKRQKELYDIVLETQKYIEEIAKPGYYLKNEDYKDKCLTSLAREFLDSKGGYGKFFTHGIGHFLGLDVHDVGKPNSPLQEGDVITIEPGLYIQEESIGIRIEDNYWIAKEKAICLSEMIPKEADQIETFMKKGFGEEQEVQA
ncbi:aminopeptidase P N-terminal domain-containing protein [Candidatus Dependentiae bacterium]